MIFKTLPAKRPAFQTETNPMQRPVQTPIEQPTGPKAGPATRFGGIKKMLSR